MKAFEPYGERQAAFFLPVLPASASSQALIGARTYLNSFTDDHSLEAWESAARGFAKLVPTNVADLAVKLLIGLHFNSPGAADGRPAIVNNFEHEIAGEIILGVASDLLSLAEIRAPAQTTYRATWEVFRAEYERLRQVFEQDEAKDADQYCAAMDRLLAVPAPDHDALAHKIQLVRERWADFATPDHVWGQILSDVQLLGGL